MSRAQMKLLQFLDSGGTLKFIPSKPRAHWVRVEWYGEMPVHHKTVSALLHRDWIAIARRKKGCPVTASITTAGQVFYEKERTRKR